MGAVFALLYLAVTLALYAPSLHGRFVSDDFLWLDDARRVTCVSDFLTLRPPHYASGDGARFSPVQLALFWSVTRGRDVTPFPLHCMMIVLVALNAFLLHLWTRRLSGGHAAACVAGLVFLFFPDHRGTVEWLSAINEPLLGAATLGCLLCFESWRRSNRIVYYVASLLLCVTALMSKASAVTLPFVLLAADATLFGGRGKRLLWRHLPFCAVLAAFLLLGRASPAGDAHFNPPHLVAAGAVRYTLAAVIGAANVQSLPPRPALDDMREDWTFFAVAAILYSALFFALFRTRGSAFHLIWVPLSVLPYALVVPGTAVAARYGWQTTLALAGWAGCVAGAALHFPGGQAHRPLARRGVVGLLITLLAWEACASVSTVALSVAPDDTAVLAAKVRAAVADLGPNATVYVYQQPGEQNTSGRVMAYFGNLAEERIHDWYDMLAQNALGDDDVALMWEPAARSVTDLSASVRRALATRRSEPRDAATAASDARVEAARPLRIWNLRDPRDRAQWHAEPSAGFTLGGPVLNLGPFDVCCVEAVFGDTRRPPPALICAWSSPLGGGWGPARCVSGRPSSRDGKASLLYYPPSRPTWWIEGGVRSFYFVQAGASQPLSLDSVILYAPLVRAHAPSIQGRN